ncbi:MAG: DNA repair protein RadA [Thermoanaerobacteraceae bacterium]|nr:DNA repair protein RadA [Thermoanaerobacteraceae bacterium]
MAKDKTAYVCIECGYRSSKWMGRCPACNSWNTMIEEIKEDEKKSSTRPKLKENELPVSLDNIESLPEERTKTGINEFDRVLGGGFVKGSLVLIGGDPGIGKSTLILQAAINLASSGYKVLYVSGEESINQIKMRAKRIGRQDKNLFVASETQFARIEDMIGYAAPAFLVIDSIQTMYDSEINTSAGSVSQIKLVTSRLMDISKINGITTMVIGHVTKEGILAGPRVLEHMVDTVLYFEGDRSGSYRVIRAAKNRFGSTNEVGLFEMSESGLISINNPSEILLGQRNDSPGSVISCAMEGTRPLLVEIQALVTPTIFGMPRRMVNDLDYNRFLMVTAVLEKQVGLKMQGQDIYANAVGGLKLTEPAQDLSMALAIASSYKERPVNPYTMAIGEIGLTGEIRSISNIENRIREAMRSGLKKIIIPYANKNRIKSIEGIEIFGARMLSEALKFAFKEN